MKWDSWGGVEAGSIVVGWHERGAVELDGVGRRLLAADDARFEGQAGQGWEGRGHLLSRFVNATEDLAK